MTKSSTMGSVNRSVEGSAFNDARLKLAKLHVRSAASFRNVFNKFAAIVTETLQVDRFGVWLLIDEGRSLRCLYLFQNSKSDTFEGAVLHQRDFPDYFEALANQRVISVNSEDGDQLANQMYESYFKPLGITALLDAPLFRGGSLFGVVCNEHTGSEREWTTDECAFAVSVGEIIARLFEEADRVKAETSMHSYQYRLMEIHRMEALGHLAAGVAHDFRNVLTVILGQCEYISSYENVPPTVKDAIGDIEKASNRGNSLTAELLTFGRKSADAPLVLDLGQAVGRMQSMLQLAVGRAVDIGVDIHQPLSRVFIDPSQLERAIMNLVMNSRDALVENQGRVTICLRDETIQDDDEGGTYVCLSVRDTGAGMDEKTRNRIFDPFFTTKGDKGTGLGLAIVYQIVSRAGGFIKVNSELGKGTVVNIYLPRIGAPA